MGGINHEKWVVYGIAITTLTRYSDIPVQVCFATHNFVGDSWWMTTQSLYLPVIVGLFQPPEFGPIAFLGAKLISTSQFVIASHGQHVLV